VAPHSFVSRSSAVATLVEYPAFLQHKQGLLVGLASDVKKGVATLQGGETLAFDYAVVCTGSSYPAGVKPSDTQLTDKASRLQQFADIKAKVSLRCKVYDCQPPGKPSTAAYNRTCLHCLQIEAAATVVVVGGGAVGVEIASEVKEAHPDKQVTLVCGESLLGRMNPKAGEFAAQWFKKHGVEVLVGERIRCGEAGHGCTWAGARC
jgi:NADH dehydrogenase FAD-containing subunit